MNKKQFYEKLESIINSIKELNELSLEDKTISIRKHNMRAVMNEIMEVYLAIQVDSSLKSDSEFERYLNESAKLFYGTITADIHMYIRSIESLLNLISEPGEWEKICWRRSALEALKELYQNTVFEKYLDQIDTDEDFNERLEFLSEREGPVSEEEIPNGIPSSHWWWWGEEPEESDYEIAG